MSNHHDHRQHGRPLVGRHASLFDTASGLALGWLYRKTAALVVADLPNGGRVLDVGTGPGRLLLAIAHRRPDAHLTGIDPSADMVGHADRHVRHAGLQNADVRVAAAEDLPFADSSFDAVISTLSGHHWGDPVAAIAEQQRVLRPGGHLWIVDLRAKSAGVIPAALRAAFPFESISQPRLGRLPGALLMCHRAVKP